MNELKSKYVIELLKSHSAKKRKIEQLKFELKNPATVEEKELIETLSIGERALENGGKSNRISDKTMTIALQYQDAAQRINIETINAIMLELRTLETDVERLEHYISLLDKKLANVINLFYFENKTWPDLEKELHLSKRTLMHQRDEAVAALVSMYSYINKLKGKTGNDEK